MATRFLLGREFPSIDLGRVGWMLLDASCFESGWNLEAEVPLTLQPQLEINSRFMGNDLLKRSALHADL